MANNVGYWPRGRRRPPEPFNSDLLRVNVVHTEPPARAPWRPTVDATPRVHPGMAADSIVTADFAADEPEGDLQQEPQVVGADYAALLSPGATLLLRGPEFQVSEQIEHYNREIIRVFHIPSSRLQRQAFNFLQRLKQQLALFEALRQELTDALKNHNSAAHRDGKVADKVTRMVLEAYAAGLISEKVALQELRQIARVTGKWTDEVLYYILYYKATLEKDIMNLKSEYRAVMLLRSWLNSKQLEEFDQTQGFTVIGSESKQPYKITYAEHSYNVIKPDGTHICFAPRNVHAPGDIMLAQKIELETGESGVLKIANEFRSMI